MNLYATNKAIFEVIKQTFIIEISFNFFLWILVSVFSDRGLNVEHDARSNHVSLTEVAIAHRLNVPPQTAISIYLTLSLQLNAKTIY